MSECRDRATVVLGATAPEPPAAPAAASGPLAALAGQFVRFAMLGAVGTAAHYAVLVAFVRLLSGDPLAGSVAGCVTGMLINYFLARRYAFRSNVPHRRALWRFVLIATAGLFLNTALMWLLVRAAGLHYLLAQVAATGTVVVWNFVPNRFWTFAAAERPAHGSPVEGA
jgi:putative flippase GtrA